MAEHINWHKTPGMDSKYLAEFDLPGKQDLVAKIADIGVQKIQSQTGIEEKIVIKFEGIDKPMICNKTNIKAISKALDTDYLDEMVGKAIQLYRDQISVGGKGLVKCIRVRDFPPANY